MVTYTENVAKYNKWVVNRIFKLLQNADANICIINLKLGNLDITITLNDTQFTIEAYSSTLLVYNLADASIITYADIMDNITARFIADITYRIMVTNSL